MIVKICGIRTPVDARNALAAGTDWIGLNLVAGPRKIDATQMTRIVQHVGEPRRIVTLLDRLTDESLQLLHENKLNHVQWYGTRNEVFTRAIEQGIEFMPVIRVQAGNAGTAIAAEVAAWLNAGCNTVLFDHAEPGKLGGTGTTIPHERLYELVQSVTSTDRSSRFMLAGGLTPENVGPMIAAARPYGVDVSSGVEARIGVKSKQKMTEFVAAARAAFAENPFE